MKKLNLDKIVTGYSVGKLWFLFSLKCVTFLKTCIFNPAARNLFSTPRTLRIVKPRII